MREERDFECIDSATGQETQLVVLGTTERVLYTVQSIQNVLHYDAIQKELESYGNVEKLRETGGMHRPELNGNTRKQVEQTRSNSIVQGLGSDHAMMRVTGHIYETSADIALSSAPEVTSSYVTTWVRVGVNRARACTIQVVSSMFRDVPFVSAEFWTMHSAGFS